MAKKSQNSVEIETLIRRSEVARLHLGLAHRELKRKLDVSTRFQNSMKKEPAKWLGVSLAVGLVGSFFLRKRKKDQAMFPATISSPAQKEALWLRTLKLTIKLAKPAVKVYMAKMLKDYVEKKGLGARNLG